MRKISKAAAVILSAAVLFGCGRVSDRPSGGNSSGSGVRSHETDISGRSNRDPETTPVATPEPKENEKPKEVVVYFTNWKLKQSDARNGGEVAGIPWSQVTYINHAYWTVVPSGDDTQSSFDRRDAGLPPRTEFRIESTDEKNDLIEDSLSLIDPSMKRNHFAEYAVMKTRYPDVKVLLSIGGWNDSGYLSEMAYTREGRKSFIDSCIETMKTYTFIDGFDIAWQYPGGTEDGERLSEGSEDQGCPIWGTSRQDQENFTALCKEMREAFDEEFGEGKKKITAMCSASTGWALPYQDWLSPSPYLDLINCATFDMAGNWDETTGHASAITDLDGVYRYFMDKNIPVEKVTVTTPMYATVFKIKEELDPARIDNLRIDKDFSVSSESFTQNEIAAIESEAVSGYTITVDENGKPVVGASFDNGGVGWHMGYNKAKEAPYIWNDDPDSYYYKWYISYENEVSLAAKLEFIHHYDLAGIAVWEVGADTSGYDRIREIGASLLNKSYKK